MNNKVKLFIDLDVIAANNGTAFEKMIESIDYKASKSYMDEITRLYLKHQYLETDYEVLLNNLHDLRDRIIEEVEDKYKGLIDYTKLYEVNDFNKSMVDYVNNISSLVDTNIIFYYNTERDRKEKEMICKTVFPNSKIIPIKYYQENYSADFKRSKVNKSEYIIKKMGLESLNGCLLIDKSKLACEEWSKLGGHSSLYYYPKPNSHGKIRG